MRTVAAVLALVACVHAGIWALLRPEVKAPDVTGQLASVSYAPFVNATHPDSGERPTEEQIRAEREASIPAKRFGRPEEFGELCAFLASAQAGYITGQNILIDGGAFPGTF